VRSICLNDTAYRGRVSPPAWTCEPPSLNCQRCGSSLAGRREASRQQTTQGIRYVVEVFRCRCGRGRHLKREAAAG
jgi:hypothetical protein